jgi:flagellar biogenesis protein FliO
VSAGLKTRLDVQDGQLLAGVDAQDVSVVVAAPTDADLDDLQEAVDDASRELAHSLEVSSRV